MGEVLPTIRKTGGYAFRQRAHQVLSDPNSLRGFLLDYTEKVIARRSRTHAPAPQIDPLGLLGAPGISEEPGDATGCCEKKSFGELAATSAILHNIHYAHT